MLASAGTSRSNDLGLIRINNPEDTDQLNLSDKSMDYSLSAKTVVDGNSGYILSLKGEAIALLNGNDQIIEGLRTQINYL